MAKESGGASGKSPGRHRASSRAASTSAARDDFDYSKFEDWAAQTKVTGWRDDEYRRLALMLFYRYGAHRWSNYRAAPSRFTDKLLDYFVWQSYREAGINILATGAADQSKGQLDDDLPEMVGGAAVGALVGGPLGAGIGAWAGPVLERWFAHLVEQPVGRKVLRDWVYAPLDPDRTGVDEITLPPSDDPDYQAGLAMAKAAATLQRKHLEASGAIPPPTAPPAPIDEIDLFDDFVPDIFAPESTEIMDEKIHAVARQLLGRRLRPDELANAQAKYRQAERGRYTSTSKLGRRQHQIAKLEQIADQLLQAAVARLHAENLDWTADQVLHEAEGDPAYRKAIQAAQDEAAASFTEYGEEEAQFDVASAVSSISPLEQAGVQVRSAAESLVKAIGRGGYRGPP